MGKRLMSPRMGSRYIYAKTCRSVGSVGSICKGLCFKRINFKKVNQHTPVLNQQRGSLNQHLSVSYTVLQC